MGVDAVLMVENSRNISLEAFLHSLEMDAWGRHSLLRYSSEPDFTAWIEFEWEGKRYFSLRSGTPRYSRLVPHHYDFESENFYDNPDFDSAIQALFLKTALAAETIAGGPVHLGNDVIHRSEPPEDIENDEIFSIPMEIDSLINNWREIAAVDVA